jgi:hypothetical protein
MFNKASNNVLGSAETAAGGGLAIKPWRAVEHFKLPSSLFGTPARAPDLRSLSSRPKFF